MKKEVGILYKTVCDVCGADVENDTVGMKCDVCKKDFCKKCRWTIWYASYGDIYSDETLAVCNKCNENPPKEIKDIADQMYSLCEMRQKSLALYNSIEEKIRGVKKDG
jgi:hypothetical protein